MTLKKAANSLGAVISQTNVSKHPIQWAAAHAAQEAVAGLSQEIVEIRKQQCEIIRLLNQVAMQLNQK